MPLPVIRVGVTIDTEEDNWGPTPPPVTIENIRELPALQARFDRLRLRPTYFTAFQVLAQPWAARIIGDLGRGGTAEIAAHVHPWNTPPFAPPHPKYVSMLHLYSRAQQREKIQRVVNGIEAATGQRPVAFRAGRFGLGPGTVSALIDLGFTADSSVTPLMSWHWTDDGPNFSRAPNAPYRLDGSGDIHTPSATGLVEIPLSSGFARYRMTEWPSLDAFLKTAPARLLHIEGIMSRMFGATRTIISPENATVPAMLRLSKALVDGGVPHLQAFLHSSSLVPGLTPFTRTAADVRRMLDRIDQWLQGLTAFCSPVPATISEVARDCST